MENADNVNVSKEPPNKKLRIDSTFISFMLSPAAKTNFQFLVGDPMSEQPPEEIVAVKELLMLYSEPFRLMLQDSPLAEKGLVHIPDIQPDTFKNFLRFLYGWNETSTLTLEEAVDLLYVAEKYMVKDLKTNLTSHICLKLRVDNICTVLEKPVCFQQPLLNNAILKIIQGHTDVLLRQKQFFDLNTFGILCILQQNTLSVTEIELWRALLKWANNKVMDQDDKTVRQLIEEPLEYMRLCTLSLEDVFEEIRPTNLLTQDELLRVIESIVKGNMFVTTTNISIIVKKRNLISHEIVFYNDNDFFCKNKNKTCMTIQTGSAPMLLMNALFESKVPRMVEGGVHFECECKVSVVREVHPNNETVVEFVFKQDLKYGTVFSIPFSSKGNDFIKLLSHSKYILSFLFKGNCTAQIKCCIKPRLYDIYSISNNIVLTSYNEKGWFSHVKKINYRCGMY